MGTPRLSQFEQDQPIIRSQSIASGGEGHEQSANILGQAAKASFDSAINIEKERSNEQLINQQVQLKKVQDQTKLQIYQNPELSQTILENTKNTINGIKQNAFVNKEDRSSLNKQADELYEDLSFQASKAHIDSIRNQQKTDFYMKAPLIQEEISDAMYRNPEQAKEKFKSYVGYVISMVRAGVLTPVEGGGQLGRLNLEFEKQEQINQLANLSHDQHPEASQIHAAYAYTASGSPPDYASLPSNEHTSFVSDLQFKGMSISNAEKYIATTGKTIPPIFYRGKDDASVVGISQFTSGAAQANGIITSNGDHNYIEQLYKSSPENTPQQRGFRARLKSYLDNLEKGGYRDMIMDTTLGQQAQNDFVSNSRSIVSNNQINNENKEQLLNNEYNDFHRKLTVIARGSNVPAQYTNIFSRGDVATIKGMYDTGSDISSGINLLSRVDPTLLVYMTNGLSSEQGQASYVAGQAIHNKADEGLVTNFIKSQQKGNDFSALKYEGDGDKKNDKKIGSQLLSSSDMRPLLSYFSSLSNGGQLEASMVKTVINYVKSRAIDSKDFDLSNLKQYINEVKNLYGSAYGIVSTSQYVYDTHAVPVSKEDMDAINNYVLEKAYAEKGKELTPFQLDREKSVNPYHMVVMPTGQIYVADKSNQIVTINKINPETGRKFSYSAYNHYYTPDILAAAKAHHKSKREVDLNFKNSIIDDKSLVERQLG